MSQAESGRRILWIVGIYRAVCGAALLGTALLLDLKALGIVDAERCSSPYAALYFIFGLATFWMRAARDGCRCACRRSCSRCLPATSSSSRW